MKTPRLLTLLALSSLLALPARAAVLEDFSGYKADDSVSTGQTLGAAANGWTGGWRTSSSYVATTGRIGNAKPLDSSQYLDVAIVTTAGQPNKTSGAISRPYRIPAQPFTLTFLFRPDTADKDIRYSIFDNDVRAAGSAGTASWQIESHAGVWRLIDGQGNGAPESALDTDMPVTPGTAYTFTLVINPGNRVWGVTISDGKRTVSHKDLHFRTGNVTPERWVHFGANELSAPAVGVTIGYSIDSLSIQP